MSLELHLLGPELMQNSLPLLDASRLGKVSDFFSLFTSPCLGEVAGEGAYGLLLELFVSELSDFSGEDLFLFFESSDQFLVFSGLF